MHTNAPKTKSTIETQREKAQARENASQATSGMAPRLIQEGLAHPERLDPRTILRLQRMAGNRAVSRLLLQARLTVGAANDAYEQEADRVAHQVMTMPIPSSIPTRGSALQREAPPEEEGAQAKPLTETISRIRRQEVPEEEEAVHTSRLQQEGEGSFSTSGDFENRLKAARSGGVSLPESLRNDLEPRFGADFSAVRLHTGAEASTLNREVHARAFTLGSDIFIGEGQYDPRSQQGKELLAHELTHTIQQGTGAHRKTIQRIDEDEATIERTDFPVEDNDNEGPVPEEKDKNAPDTYQIEPQKLNSLRASGLLPDIAMADLSSATEITGFATQAKSYWRANPHKDYMGFAADIMAILTSKLFFTPKPVKMENAGSNLLGQFCHNEKSFFIYINIAKFTDRQVETKTIDKLNDEEVDQIIETIYHEVRHAEQILRVAQMLAGQNKKPDEISTMIQIPKDASLAAASHPLTSAPDSRKEDKEMLEKANKWLPYFNKSMDDYKHAVLDLFKIFKQAQKSIEKVSGNLKTNLDTAIKRLKVIKRNTFSQLPLNETLQDSYGVFESIKDTKRKGVEEKKIDNILKAKINYEDALKLEINEIKRFAEGTKKGFLDGYRDNLSRLIENMKNTLHEAYMAFAEEADAWKVGGEIRAELKKRE